nr:uncharacterized protein LOC131789042 [Pocillopora verrucosa]
MGVKKELRALEILEKPEAFLTEDFNLSATVSEPEESGTPLFSDEGTFGEFGSVLQNLVHLMPQLSVRQVTVDFEKAIWSAIREVLPTVKIQGCVFHWTQAVWRKVQELGLQRAYMDDDSVYKYIRKLMALPFLPYPEIQPMFDLLEEQAQTDELGRLVQYIRRQWIESEV